jgi:hypothetical protein
MSYCFVWGTDGAMFSARTVSRSLKVRSRASKSFRYLLVTVGSVDREKNARLGVIKLIKIIFPRILGAI